MYAALNEKTKQHVTLLLCHKHKCAVICVQIWLYLKLRVSDYKHEKVAMYCFQLDTGNTQ